MQQVRVPMESLIEVIRLQLESGGRANLTVTGYSMHPMLRQYRDSVQLEPLKEALKPGDVALFQRSNGRYVLHRVIKLTPEGYLFCGDNQYEPEPVRQEQLFAIVTGFTRKNKQYSINAVGYRIYRWLWTRLFCFRKYYIRLRRFVGRLYSRYLRRKRK